MIDSAAKLLRQGQSRRRAANVGKKTADDRESRAAKQICCTFERAVQLGFLPFTVAIAAHT